MRKVLFLVMLISFLSAHAEILTGNCGKDGDNLTYTLDTETGVLKIEGSGEMSDYRTAPWYDYRESIFVLELSTNISSIGQRAFRNCSNITSVSIPNSVTSIGSLAFGNCSGLTSVTIPSDISSLDDIFSGCSNLKSIIDPMLESDSHVILPSNKWSNCQYIADAIIYDGGYYGYEENIYNPNYNVIVGTPAIDSNGRQWYEEDYILTNDERSSQWGKKFAPYTNYFDSSSNRSHFGDIYIRREFDYNGENLGEVLLCCGHDDAPCEYYLNGVMIWSATDGWNELETFLLTDSQKSLLRQGRNVLAFHVHQNWGGSYADVGLYSDYIVGKSDNTTKYTLSFNYETLMFEGTGVCKSSIVSNSFEITTKIKNVIISNGITGIGYYAFNGGYPNLVSVTIPNSVTTVGYGAFEGLYNISEVNISLKDDVDFENYILRNDLQSIFHEGDLRGKTHNVLINGEKQSLITIPNSVASIANYAFSSCSGLTSMTIPNSVTSIGEWAFYNCSSLTSVTIGNSVTSIGTDAFADCNKLADVTNLSTTPQIIGNSVFSVYGFLHVLPGCKEAYENTLIWRMFHVKDDAQMPVDPSLNQCAKPEIAYENGALVFTCETDGAVCHSNIEVSDAGLHNGNAVNLNATYNITVYATLDGYNSSEIATATIVWLNATLDTDAINAPEIRVAACPVLVSSDNGVVTISGLADGETVEFYTTDGKLVNTTKAFGDTATCLSQSGVMIMKVGQQSIKVMVK